MSNPGFTIKARRFDPRDDGEAMDLMTFDLIEIKHGHNRVTMRVQNMEGVGLRLIVSGDNALAIYPRGANWIEIPL